jgi:hypothetical protein
VAPRSKSFMVMMVMKLVGEGFEGGLMQASRNNDRRCRKDCSADQYVRTCMRMIPK